MSALSARARANQSPIGLWLSTLLLCKWAVRVSLHMFSLTAGANVVDLAGTQTTQNVQWHMTAMGPGVTVLEPTNPQHVLRFGWVGLGGYTGIGALQYIQYFFWMNFEYEFMPLLTPNLQCFTYYLFPGCTADLWLNY